MQPAESKKLIIIVKRIFSARVDNLQKARKPSLETT
jgi:hypothetical protein